jgi:DNA-binding MarR family transcriptional regulator
VGNDFMEMGVSLQDWHLIESVHALPKSDRSPSSLSRILGVSPAALSYTLDQLEQAGILKRVAKKVGARGCVVQLTSKGEKERARLLGKATEFFAKHLTIPFGEFRQAVDIFSRIMANAKAPKHVKLSPIPFTTTVIPEPAPCCTVKHTTNMSQLARGFMMRQIVSAGIEAYAPASIFESSGQFYELELGGLLIGVAQIREEKAGGNEVELACLIVLKDIATAVIPFLMQSINRELMDAGRVLRFEGTSGVFSNLQESLLSALLASVIQSKGYKANP